VDRNRCSVRNTKSIENVEKDPFELLEGKGVPVRAMKAYNGKEPEYPQSKSGWSWRREKSLAPAEIQAPDCLAHSKSLYRLHYPDFCRNLKLLPKIGL
jgi:hypothetical protein